MYFQDTNGNLHWLSDDDIARGGMSLLPQGCIQITDEQAATIQAAIPKPINNVGAVANIQNSILMRKLKRMVK